jgi:hypothetical protein
MTSTATRRNAHASARDDALIFPFIKRPVCVAAILGCLLNLICTHVDAEEKVAICHAGLITLPSFEQHVADLREAKRFDQERIDKLILRNRIGGLGFFSSQIIIQEHISGSGTYDLRLFHGLSGPHTKFRNITPWGCDGDDYPIVYFVGFRVREIQDNQIRVSREKDVVNVISLKSLDPSLGKPTSVRMYRSDQILCADIGVGCIESVLYDKYES